MQHSQSGFTLVEATALVVIMALVVVSVTPKFAAWGLTARICSFPDFRRHAECLGTAKDQPATKN
jgi:Tfp pilus assembly protein FimT